MTKIYNSNTGWVEQLGNDISALSDDTVCRFFIGGVLVYEGELGLGILQAPMMRVDEIHHLPASGILKGHDSGPLIRVWGKTGCLKCQKVFDYWVAMGYRVVHREYDPKILAKYVGFGKKHGLFSVTDYIVGVSAELVMQENFLPVVSYGRTVLRD